MSAREWKPGDVAIVTYKVADQPSLAYGDQHAIRWEYGWIVSESQGHEIVHDRYVSEVRPLVGIDPEDREQAWRLSQEYDKARANIGGNAAAMQAALREFANPTPPPKPDEPTRIGAVVEDADGTLWTRVTRNSDCAWVWSLDSSNLEEGEATGCPWDRFAAVKVLSEGVTP